MPLPFFPDSYTLADVTAKRAAWALAVVRLFKSGLVPNHATLIASLEAVEADYSTYAPETITAWLAPVGIPGGGNSITAPTVQFELAADPAVANTIGGYWIETAAGAVILIRQFDNPVAMTVTGNYVRVNPTVITPNGAS